MGISKDNYSSKLQIYLSALHGRQDNASKIPITRNRRAAPEPFTCSEKCDPQTVRLSDGCTAINGSNTLSTSTQPHRYPKGMVKNCKVFLTEYTRPCISIEILLRKSTSILPPITGMNIHPRTAPRHQTGVLLPKARIKFSVLMEKASNYK